MSCISVAKVVVGAQRSADFEHLVDEMRSPMEHP